MTTIPIATVSLSAGARLGLCGLPVSWDDLKQVVDWRPDIVVSLTEATEMLNCDYGDFEKALAAHQVEWHHLPVRDYDVPNDSAAWRRLATLLHDRLCRSGSVLLHCKAGKGRSGMIALRLLIAQGLDPSEALKRLRLNRPGAVETDAQHSWATQTPDQMI